MDSCFAIKIIDEYIMKSTELTYFTLVKVIDKLDVEGWGQRVEELN